MIVRFYVGLDKANRTAYEFQPPLELLVGTLIKLGQGHADKLFGGSTVYRAVGSWHGEREAVAVFEVVADDYCVGHTAVRNYMRVFARWLRRAFGQKEVLVVKTQAEVETI